MGREARANPQKRGRSLGRRKVNARLRDKMLRVETMQQFNEIIRAAHIDHRYSMRKLLEPMLRPNLPCCGAGLLERATKQRIEVGKHGLLCPRRNRVELAE